MNTARKAAILAPAFAIAIALSGQASAADISFYTGGGSTALADDGFTVLCSTGEHCGVITFNDVVGDIDLTVTGFSHAGGVIGADILAYYDTSPDFGGMGAADTSTVSSDDNIVAGEGVRLTFSAPVIFASWVALNHAGGNPIGGSANYEVRVDGAAADAGVLGGGTANPIVVGASGTVFEFLHTGGTGPFYVSGFTGDPDNPATVPEPGVLSLLGLGLLGLGLHARRLS